MFVLVQSLYQKHSWAHATAINEPAPLSFKCTRIYKFHLSTHSLFNHPQTSPTNLNHPHTYTHTHTPKSTHIDTFLRIDAYTESDTEEKVETGNCDVSYESYKTYLFTPNQKWNQKTTEK